MIKLSPKESKAIRTGLPDDAAERIAKKKNISKRMVQYILKGDWADKHGVIQEAIKLRDQNIDRLAAIKSKI